MFTKVNKGLRVALVAGTTSLALVGATLSTATPAAAFGHGHFGGAYRPHGGFGHAGYGGYGYRRHHGLGVGAAVGLGILGAAAVGVAASQYRDNGYGYGAPAYGYDAPAYGYGYGGY